MSEHLDYLDRLADRIPSYPNKINVEYKGNHGSYFGHTLYHDNKITIKRILIPKGITTDTRLHPDSEEHTLVYEGHLIIKFQDKEVKCLAGDHFTLPPDTSHKAKALEDVSMIAITIKIK